MSQARQTRHFARSARRGEEKNKAKWKRNSEILQLLIKSFLTVENKIFSKLRMSSDQSCVNRTETVHATLRFLFLLSPIVWNMCENLHYESVYFKELYNDQEYYWPTIYRAGAAVLSTITSIINSRRSRRRQTRTIKQIILSKPRVSTFRIFSKAIPLKLACYPF